MRITVSLLGMALLHINVVQKSVSQTIRSNTYLEENTASGRSLGTFTVSGGTGPYTFSSVSQTGNLNWFTVSGRNEPELTVTVATGKTVDYEAPELASHQYQIVVKIVDSADVSSTVTLTVTVSDVNEPPTFASSELVYNSTTAPAPGIPLLNVNASDPESTDMLLYAIGNTERYAISSSGYIYVRADVTLSVGVYDQFWVTVADDDIVKPLTATGTVVVCISCSSAHRPNTGSTRAAIGVVIAMFLILTYM